MKREARFPGLSADAKRRGLSPSFRSLLGSLALPVRSGGLEQSCKDGDETEQTSFHDADLRLRKIDEVSGDRPEGRRSARFSMLRDASLSSSR